MKFNSEDIFQYDSFHIHDQIVHYYFLISVTFLY